jgi:hypothetical protein
MRKTLLFLIALASIAFGVCSPANAFGCNGWPQIAGGNGCNSLIASGGGGTYTGPGDIVSGAIGWWLESNWKVEFFGVANCCRAGTTVSLARNAE